MGLLIELFQHWRTAFWLCRHCSGPFPLRVGRTVLNKMHRAEGGQLMIFYFYFFNLLQRQSQSTAHQHLLLISPTGHVAAPRENKELLPSGGISPSWQNYNTNNLSTCRWITDFILYQTQSLLSPIRKPSSIFSFTSSENHSRSGT